MLKLTHPSIWSFTFGHHRCWIYGIKIQPVYLKTTKTLEAIQAFLFADDRLVSFAHSL
ncbi:hypothetical protein [Bacillus sp. FJAT-27231]|uniref:hypothetical protein n=1 Tax=Bacillus sp. FJAT-27231 TaxID=1679168 RepID=UPI0012E173D7|nr:hypothetical protein [Bacillus sp. FJAT-27231]